MNANKQIVTTEKLNLEAQGEKLQQGLVKLVLVIVELLREILERQAQRKINSGTLTKEETERLGIAFIQIKQKLREISDEFGIDRDLEPTLASLLTKKGPNAEKLTLVDIIDKIIDKKTVIAGQISISVAEIDLIVLNLLASISAPNASGSISKGGISL